MEHLISKHYRFGDFELDTAKRLLLKNGTSVPLNSKTFELLHALIEHHGQILTKEELLERVWPDQFVEEGNLTVHVSALRKILGEGKNEHRFIVTVPGSGYSFVADLAEGTEDEIVVQRHSVSRMVVEETESEVAEDQEFRPSLHQPKPYAGSRKWLILTGSVILIAGIAGAWVYSSRIRADIPAAATQPGSRHQIVARVFTTTGGGVPDLVAISPDGKSLVYVERLKGKHSLRLGEIESSQSVQIIPHLDRIYHYLAFAPDARNVYFTARDAQHPTWTLMRVSTLGGATQDLATDVDSAVTFSPDGKQLAFFRRDLDEVSFTTADAATGEGERVFLRLTKPDEVIGGGISWSPDGKSIAFSAPNRKGNGTVTLAANTGDGSISQIGEPVPNRIVNVAWRPDGRGLLINRNSANDAGDGQIWTVSYPGGEMQKVTNDTLNYSLFSLSVSADNRAAVLQARTDPEIWVAPDGDMQRSRRIFEGTRFRSEGLAGLAFARDGKLLFTAKTSEGRTIWEMDADGSNQRQLTPSHKDFDDSQISVTANNRFFVFESNRSGRSEVWRANRDGSDLRPLTRDGGNLQPAISPDGLWVVYISLRESKYTLQRISIEGGQPIQLTSERSSWPAVSPDGKLIAYAYDSPGRTI
jgi:DNA-binding winged helix-turn-helix (wHTH) protein/Tol biopolymer transport system component